MFKFLLSAFFTSLVMPFYLKWSQGQAEGQIDKMQQAVFNSPGAESPVPPVVLLGGAGIVAGHWLLARLLGLGFVSTFLGLIVATGAGFGYYFFAISSSRQ